MLTTSFLSFISIFKVKSKRSLLFIPEGDMFILYSSSGSSSLFILMNDLSILYSSNLKSDLLMLL